MPLEGTTTADFFQIPAVGNSNIASINFLGVSAIIVLKLCVVIGLKNNGAFLRLCFLEFKVAVMVVLSS
jgi:hypothetical protein